MIFICLVAMSNINLLIIRWNKHNKNIKCIVKHKYNIHYLSLYFRYRSGQNWTTDDCFGNSNINHYTTLLIPDKILCYLVRFISVIILHIMQFDVCWIIRTHWESNPKYRFCKSISKPFVSSWVGLIFASEVQVHLCP